jgi:prephenate dehydrogenase
MWSHSKAGRPSVDRLAILGCGLLGCSFAAAARKMGLARSIAGYSKSPTTVRRALELGHIDHGADSAMKAVSGADLVLVAVPVGATEDLLRSIKHILDDRMLVMDVGSTKRDVCQAAQRALGERAWQFVPAHPIAGGHDSGPAAAQADLFVGKLTVLTPMSVNQRPITDRAQEVWEALGSQVERMTAQQHDAAYAAVSHLPHLLAFAYMNAIVRQPHSDQFLALAGAGFRDFTRIAGSSPAMWADIVAANRDELLMQLSLFRQNLASLEKTLALHDPAAVRDALEPILTRASNARRKWQSRFDLPDLPARDDAA